MEPKPANYGANWSARATSAMLNHFLNFLNDTLRAHLASCERLEQGFSVLSSSEIEFN